MTHAYSEMYLEDATRTLGEAVDFALCDQGLTPAELTAILSNALEMKQFERGMPRVVCGMAGDELARDTTLRAEPTRPTPCLGLLGIGACKKPGLHTRRPHLATHCPGV